MAAASKSQAGALGHYRQKRDFSITSEPAETAATPARNGEKRAFVVQKHWASRLHYDFRLELDGVLVSWAVPKGPAFDPSKMQMAIHVEDHPLAYAAFEGTIPPRQYGAGRVIVWDRGSWTPVGDAQAGLAAGKLVFRLHGEKLAGLWELVRIAKPGDRQDAWMLFKKRDEWARPLTEYDVIAALPDSVVARPLGPVEEREPRGPQGEPARSAGDSRPPDLGAAVRAPLPARLEPQLAVLAETPPAGAWLVETKFDGYRVMARIDHGKARLITRGGHDWTAKMRPLAAAVEALGIETAWLDGEIVVMNAAGVPDFSALQNAIDSAAAEDIEYFVFDLPFEGGRDLRAVPLRDRRAVLEQLLEGSRSDRIRLSRTFDAPPAAMLEAARQMGLEGVILKRPDSPYVSRRSDSWIKLKCSLRQEFVVCGFTDRSGAKAEVGSLLLATHEAGGLVYSGNVGTGWDAKTGRDLHARLTAIETSRPTLDVASIEPGRWSRRSAGGERWVRPELVVEVSFREWTPDGHIRHAVFQGLRPDKPAAEVHREYAASLAPAPAAATPKASNRTATGASAPSREEKGAGKRASAGKEIESGPGPGRAASKRRVGTSPPGNAAVRLTHPERVVDVSTGLTKLDVARYYESVAERILPHLKDRPVSLVRAPEGIGGELFFQKHPETRVPGLQVFAASLWPGHAALLGIDSADALLSAAQMNTIELHTWNSTARRIDSPDRVVFDLDPGEGVTWAHVREAAILTRTLLTELGLASWPKTSGGKGLHVVVPIA
ncbi:MAG TPA: DNA ligase D, partial [Caldimonas sp.]|nr:DNA ligase D [Caldimonas sp.]